jgi:phage shock protein PspC (stress-responsive transcriptional regulator)
VLYAGVAMLAAWFFLLRAEVGNALQLTAVNGLGGLLVLGAMAYRTRHTAGDEDDVDFLTFLSGVYKLEEGEDFQIFGVCTGLGAACRIPVFVWRILFVAWTCMGAGGAAVYFILYITLPSGRVPDAVDEEDNADESQETHRELPSPAGVRPDADTMTPQLSEKTQKRLQELKEKSTDSTSDNDDKKSDTE